MTSDEYRAALDRLGLSQTGAAKVFGFGERTSRRFAFGKDIPWYVEILLNIMIKNGIQVSEIKRVKGAGHLPRAVAQLFYLVITGSVTLSEALAVSSIKFDIKKKLLATNEQEMNDD